jgi:hypothetical protein
MPTRIPTQAFAILLLSLGLKITAQQLPVASHPRSLDKSPPQRAVKFELADGVLLADASLSNSDGSVSKKGWFVVDTAATATILNQQVPHSAAGQTGKLDNQTLSLAGATVSHRNVLEYPLDAWSRQTGMPIAGIAGADIFQHFDVRIDYAHHFLTLLVPQSCAVAGEHLGLRMVAGLPLVEAQLLLADGKTLRGLFLLDTGQAGPGLVLTSEFLAAHPAIAASQPLVEVPLLSPDNTIQSTRLVRIAGLQLGRSSLPGVIASVAPPTVNSAGTQLAGVIGGGVLAHFDMLLDITHASLTLTPNGEFAQPFEADMSGMLVLAEARSGEQAYMIAGITKNSPAADAGVQAGDQLIAINGTKVIDMSLDLVRNVLKSGTGTKVVVTIDRSGKRTMVTLALRRAI